MTDAPKLNPVALCRSCQAEGRWVKTRNGKNLLVNLEGSLPTDFVFDPKRHVPHFASCPDAAKWRRHHGRNGEVSVP